MKIQLKILDLLLLLLFIDFSVQAESAAVANTKPKCKQDILSSYLLKGMTFSTDRSNILCPSIEKNCCSKIDQQKMYHIVNDILPQRTKEYEAKMEMALGKLKEFYKVIKLHPRDYSGSEERKEFCNNQFFQLPNFNTLYKKLLEALKGIRADMDSLYMNFFCVLCDFKNHRSIELTKITFNRNFCKNMIAGNIATIRLVNIELMKFLRRLQDVVDCNHYLKSYKLKFFNKSKEEIAETIQPCLDNIGSLQFMESC